jgi:predicted Zn-dependent protease
LRGVAFCWFQQNQIEKAQDVLRELLKINPKAPAPEATISEFYRQNGDAKNADKWLQAALTTSPNNFSTQLMAAQQAVASGHFDEGRNYAIAASKLDPKSLDSQILQATIAAYEKNYVTAELLFEAVLKKAPDNPAITNNLAMVLIQQNDPDKNKRALEFAEANIKKFPNSPPVASTYGYILLQLGRLDEAEQALEKAKPIAGSDLDTAYTLARVAVERGHNDEARQYLEAALKNTSPSLFRQESEELLSKLKK